MSDVLTIDVFTDPDTLVIDVVDQGFPVPMVVEAFIGGAAGPPGAAGAPGPSVAFVGPVPPPLPHLEGALWWDSFDTLELYVWYVDPEGSGQWVVANTAQGGGTANVHPLTLDAGNY